MKISILLLSVVIFSASAKSYAQEERVTLDLKNVSITDVFSTIRSQTSYSFWYDLKDINTERIVSVNAKDQKVNEILNDLFKNEDVNIRMIDKHIVLKSRNSSYTLPVPQQNARKITGKVSDILGPIIGANIIEKGTTNGVTTDIDGQYTIEVSENTILQFSYIGYVNQSVAVKNQKEINIQLKEDTQALEEVIIVGYGTSTKRSLIASVSTVKSEEIASLPVTNITQGLAGRAAGLIVQGSGGGLNKVPSISIRGGATPLIVIDGVIRSYGDFVQIAPEDITTMSILKDASATAVYGSRASDGIIQITTKKGTAGKTQVAYSFNYSLSQPAHWERTLDSWTRAEYANIARANDGLGEAFSAERIQKMRDGSDPQQNSNTNWRDETLNKFAPQSKHNFSLTGGNDLNNYYVSLGHIDQGSLYKTDTYNMKRTNIRLTESAYLKPIGLHAAATIDGSMENKKHPSSSRTSSHGTIFQVIQNTGPLFPAYNKYGLPYIVDYNPVALISSDAGYLNQNKKMINMNLAIDWSLPWIKGLKLKATGNYRYAFDDTKNWRKDAGQYDWDSTVPAKGQEAMLNNQTAYAYEYTMQYFVNYDKILYEKHAISALGGYEETYGYSKNYWVQREKYQFPIDQIEVGPESTQKNGGSEGEHGRAGWVSQLKYNYDNKYFIEGSFRYDGSDNFPVNKRWGAFYSGAIGWSIADEKFMSTLVEKNIFNSLKFRASYGQVGLDNWGSPGETYYLDRFAYLPSYTLDSKAWVLNGAYIPGFSEGGIPSSDISWFTTDQVDIGFDFSSFNNRLYGTVDYFYYKTNGFLYAPNQVNIGYTDPLGMPLPKVSTNGEHRRAGFDFSLGWRDSYGDFSYNVSANFTKFDQLWAMRPDESIQTLMNPHKRDTQQTGFYGIMYESLGYYVSADDVYNSVKRLGSYNLAAGDLKYKDFNGDGKIDDADQIRLGKNSFPRANYGINVNLEYKGFFLSMLFQGATRFDMYLSGTAAMAGGQTGDLPVVYKYHTDFYTPKNTDARYPRLMSSSGINGNNNQVSSDFWLINGAYLRMKDFSFGYNFKKALAKDTKWLSKATLALSGQNLFTISEAVKYGLDPENASVEHAAYPNERVYAISLSLGF